MWVAFLTSYLKDYWPCLVLGASLVYYLDVPDLRACCSEESWVHHVGLGSYFVTSQMAFLVHLEASLEHQEARQAYPLMKEARQLAFLGAYLGCFVASLDHQVASLGLLKAFQVRLVASQGHLVFLRAYRAYFQVQMMAFFLLLGS